MKEPNPNFAYKPRRQSSTNSSMDSKLLIDSLTAHISLYHSSSTSQSVSTNSNPRSSILKWFSSLNIQQRQAHLTIVDRKFVQILLQMQRKLQSNGHGSFIVLPDILSGDGMGLPSLCYRRSHGLLARASESNESERLIYDSIRLFNSKEGESVQECSCSANCLDSLVVSEELVENVDRFVAAMDGVSSRSFLMGEDSGLSSEWVELEWLKGKGYYSMLAFAVNRLEVALRLSWLNCNSGKKRGVKLKEKTSAAGVAANIYWRKKGCIDWWDRLDIATRQNIFQVVLGKAAKSLTAEILNGTNSSDKDNSGLFSSGAGSLSRFSYTMSSQDIVALGTTADSMLHIGPTAAPERPLLSFMSSLLVLQEIFSILYTCRHGEEEKLRVNFSSLASVSTISDCVYRKLRGLLMLVSLDCTKHELFEEGNSDLPKKKSKEKPGAANRKKKDVSRNMKCSKPIRNSLGDDTGLDKTSKEHNGISVHGKAKTGSRKSRKKNSNEVKKIPDPVEVGNPAGRTIEDSSPVISRSEAAKSDRVSDDPVIDNMPNAVSIGDDKVGPNQNNFSEGCTMQEKLVESSGERNVVRSSDGSRLGGLNDQQSDGMIENYFKSSRSDAANSVVHPDEVPPLMSDRGHDVTPSEDTECRSRGDPAVTNLKSVICEREITGCKPQEEVIPTRGKRNESVLSSGCPSYEWPSIAPMHIPSVNSHLPATTDRLHLDVGHNWKNHFHRSFVPAVHQVRNPPTENGCSRILARPVPMSLDWPPMVQRGCGLAPPVTRNYDSGFIPRCRSSFHQGFTSPSLQYGTTTIDDERIYSGDFVDFPEFSNSHELSDEQDNHWISEEEIEVHAVSGRDYSQYFGGGVMYWNSSDLPGGNFSRPPSLSSEDGSFGWREADMNRAVDDMVAFSSSYSTNGLTSPSAASFCSPFDPLAPGNQSVGYVIPGSDVSSKMLHPQSTIPDAVGEDNATGTLSSLLSEGEVKAGDSLPYPILRPIIIPNMSRERSRSDFKRSHDHKSPCVPRNRGEQPRIKRPPSPVVLCVPRAPRPPPPSSASDSRKHRGFPSVRSGSSSPRHWGLRGVLHDSLSFEEACVRMDGSEVVWPSWRNKAHAMIQPIPGALLQDHLIAITQLTLDQEHPDVAFPLEPPESLNCATRQASLSLMHNLLHDEIDAFCKQVSSENLTRKPYINWAVKRVARSLQVLWPRSRTNIFGSNATGLSLPTSDVDLVICLPPVRNLEPIKEAGILEGRNGIKETCLQHAARYLANQEWVKNDSLKIVENTAIPIIMLVVEVPHEFVASSASVSLKGEPTEIVGEVGNPSGTSIDNLESGHFLKHSSMKAGDSKDTKLIRLDISFKSPSHTGLQTTELVKELTEQFPAATPLALVLKQFLADRSLDQSYSGGLSSYCLVLLITRFLQHEYHRGRPINQNFGGLLMDFFYFFGNVFDPRQMRISVRGSGLYITRERGCSIDPIYIDDPLYPTNNVGRNCFRIHQCIKAFADAYSALENELTLLPNDGESSSGQGYNLLPKIIPSIGPL